MRILGLVTGIVTCIGLVPVFAFDFAAGMKAYEAHDFTRAMREWRPLADAGDAMAQFNLGLLHYEGQGAPQDYAEAARWFQSAADQGYAKAQLNLGALYGSGKGVKRDYARAYMWLSLCAATGDEKCATQRDLVAAKLNAKTLALAQKQAREWKPIKK